MGVCQVNNTLHSTRDKHILPATTTHVYTPYTMTDGGDTPRLKTMMDILNLDLGLTIEVSQVLQGVIDNAFVRHETVRATVRAEIAEAEKEEQELGRELERVRLVDTSMADYLAERLEGISDEVAQVGEKVQTAVQVTRKKIEGATNQLIQAVSLLEEETNSGMVETMEIQAKTDALRQSIDSKILNLDHELDLRVMKLNLYRGLGVRVLTVEGKESVCVYDKDTGGSTVIPIDGTFSQYFVTKQIWDLIK